MHGFQLWANLPALAQDDEAALPGRPARDIPEVTDDDGTIVRVVCGDFWGKRGPVEGVAADPRYLDMSVPPGKRKTLPVETTRHAFAYVFEGSGTFRDASAAAGRAHRRVEADGDEVRDAIGQSLARAVRSRRRSHGAGRRRGHPVPARVGQADRGTGGVVRARS